ncbi:MAG: hypothetical protein ACLPT6_02850 [Desulfobaccales bacterium]
MISDGEDFSKNIFINCPFDSKYTKLLRPILFTIIYLGYNPRIASERSDSGEARFTKICELIGNSKFSIHDISRLKASKKLEYYRLNMPYELGVDIGCRLFGSDKFKEKRCIIFEKDKYSYQKALSDLSGFDIKAHNNKPRKIIEELRYWFVENDAIMPDSATIIWDNFNLFMTDFELTTTAKGYEQKDIQKMPIHEFIYFIKKWLIKNK